MDSQDNIRTLDGPDGAGALDAIVEQYQGPLLRYAARILRDPDAAQDVVQDTFIKMYRGWTKGSRPAPEIKGWLYRVTHNAAVDYIRRQSRLRALHENQARESEVAAPAEQRAQVERRDAMTLVLRYLGELEPEEQQILVLRVEHDLSYKEISEITKRTEGNIGCILHHAMKKLARHLKRAGAI
jgi:RNA polymerase sigma-70 factor (ECF subfamily)